MFRLIWRTIITEIFHLFNKSTRYVSLWTIYTSDSTQPELAQPALSNVHQGGPKYLHGSTSKHINDEFCPDEDYHEVDNVGKTAFRCHQCRMSFLPKNYKEGNTIETFESCRRHIGVLKCEHCAFVLVGLTRIRCHRQVFQSSARYGGGVPHTMTPILIYQSSFSY